MHFCAITKSNECSLFACFESLQCPKIVPTVIKKGMFFKSFRGAAPDPAGGAYSAPLDPQLVFTWADPLFFTMRRPCQMPSIGTYVAKQYHTIIHCLMIMCVSFTVQSGFRCRARQLQSFSRSLATRLVPFPSLGVSY